MPVYAHIRRMISTRKAGHTELVFVVQSGFVSRSCMQDYRSLCPLYIGYNLINIQSHRQHLTSLCEMLSAELKTEPCHAMRSSSYRTCPVLSHFDLVRKTGKVWEGKSEKVGKQKQVCQLSRLAYIATRRSP